MHPGLGSGSFGPAAMRRPIFPSGWSVRITTSDSEQLAAWLAECALGNRQSFEALYCKVSARLHAVALRCMKRSDLAEEIVQESFIKIWHNASRYQPHLSAPLTWMINITRNQAIDQLRKRRELPLDPLLADSLVDDGPSAHEQLAHGREAQALNRCLESLEGNQKKSIIHAYFAGLSNSELATQMAAPLGSVKSWIRRGMERLRRCLET